MVSIPEESPRQLTPYVGNTTTEFYYPTSSNFIITDFVTVDCVFGIAEPTKSALPSSILVSVDQSSSCCAPCARRAKTKKKGIKSATKSMHQL
jgi:hypothetical protein